MLRVVCQAYALDTGASPQQACIHSSLDIMYRITRSKQLVYKAFVSRAQTDYALFEHQYALEGRYRRADVMPIG